MRKVIVIVIDSVRQDHIGCYGYPRDTTPNIDRMAATGAKLNGYIPEPMLPGTAPAAYSLLSGQKDEPLRLAECPQNIPLLQRFVKPALFCSNHGLFFSRSNWHVDWDYYNLRESRPLENMAGEYLVEWFLDAYPKISPAFSLLWFTDTHGVYQYDDTWKNFLDDDEPTVSGDVRFYDPPLLNEAGGRPNFRKHMAYYDAAIHRIDSVIAPIFDLADEDTLIIVCSDHGDFMGEFGHWFTHSYRRAEEEYSEGCEILRPVLMVMSIPLDSSSPIALADKVTLMDVTTTVAAWTGVPKQHWWVGRSLVSYRADVEGKSSANVSDKILVDERLRALGYIE